MKATGIVRRIDELGRLVIPMELRKKMEIRSEDPIEIFVEDDRIILSKYQPNCLFCGTCSNVRDLYGKKVCTACIEKLKSME